MKRALVIVDHGSRLPEAHAHLEGIAARLRMLAPELEVLIAHMELAEPTLEKAIARAAQAGVSEVIVYPLFVAPGRHLTHDIPELLRQAAAGHPGLRLRMADPLGSAAELPELILRAL